ncbi:hypothetical protein AO242_20335 [Pseudomonas sp. ICMP 561]|nr:hypothetical protein AO242_20335 [Pseudomonas sp. ICMP 561]
MSFVGAGLGLGGIPTMNDNGSADGPHRLYREQALLLSNKLQLCDLEYFFICRSALARDRVSTGNIFID